jgi:hypothetical protein
MLFASKITGKVEIGETTIDIKALSRKKLEKANEFARGDGIVAAKQAGAELVKAFHELARAEAAGEITPDVKRKARYAQYDITTVLQAGITRITPAPEGETAEAGITKAIEEMLMADAQKIHEAILDLSLPELDAPKGAAAPSTGS